jgi:hypothetical protein
MRHVVVGAGKVEFCGGQAGVEVAQHVQDGFGVQWVWLRVALIGRVVR